VPPLSGNKVVGGQIIETPSAASGRFAERVFRRSIGASGRSEAFNPTPRTSQFGPEPEIWPIESAFAATGSSTLRADIYSYRGQPLRDLQQPQLSDVASSGTKGAMTVI
jgi:hypothetical protein